MEGLMKTQRATEGKDVNGVVKNKNEDWSSVWSSLSPAALRVFRACPNSDNNSLSKRELTRARVFTHACTHLMAPAYWDL